MFAGREATSPWPRRAGVAAALALAVFAAGFFALSDDTATTGSLPPQAKNAAGVPAAPLELMSLRHTQQRDSITITGKYNISLRFSCSIRFAASIRPSMNRGAPSSGTMRSTPLTRASRSLVGRTSQRGCGASVMSDDSIPGGRSPKNAFKPLR